MGNIWTTAHATLVKDAGKWDIANLGAILFAGRLSDFGLSVARKGIRAVVYRGNGKAGGVRDKADGTRGYALDLDWTMFWSESVLMSR